MQKYQNNIINTNGVPVVGASVTITTYPGGATATLYSDNGVTTTANPLTTDAFGIFSFYAADGRYSAAITGAGVTPSSVTDILLEDPADGNTVVITGGTITGATINATPIGATTPSSGAFTTISATGAISTSDDIVLNKTTATTSLRFNNSGSSFVIGTDNSAGNAYSGGGVPYAANYYSFGVAPHIWSINGSEKMRIDTSGNLGIGVVPSAWGSNYKAIEAQTGAAFVLANGNVNPLTILCNAYFNSSGIPTYKTTGQAASYENGNLGSFKWFTAPSGTAGNAITFAQSLAVGNGTTLALEGATSATGVGIAFPATQVPSANVNTLDDYEEGTWTPSFTSLTVVNGTGSATYSGTYTKVGRLCKWKAQITVTGTCTTACAQGTTKITNLPFTAAGQDICIAASFSASLGAGINTATTEAYPATWAARNENITISGSFEV